MILTVTLNPCLDKSLFVQRNVPIESLRTDRTVDLAGGKGVNVARALAALGEPVRAFMPLGGYTGAAVADLARREGLTPVVVPINGRTRTALTVREEATGTYWHYLEPGPVLDAADLDRIRAGFEEAARDCEFIVLSGSLPSPSAGALVPWLIETGRELGCRVALDSHGAGLRLGLDARPWLVKPNREELSGLHKRCPESDDAVWDAVRELASSGIAVVLVSAGGSTLFASWEGEEWEVEPPGVELVNALGCGDSLMAGVLFAVRRGLPAAEALRWGVACGAANAMVWDPGGIRLPDVQRLSQAVHLRRRTGEMFWEDTSASG